MLVALDPGLNRSGLALFQDGELVFADAVKISARGDVVSRAARMGAKIVNVVHVEDFLDAELIVELPQIYQREGGKSKGSPNLLIPLAVVCGAVAVSFVDVHSVLPSAWKGQVPKQTRTGSNPVADRVVARLTALERQHIAAKAPHDVYDAVGIGLWHLGRFERLRVFPGAT